LGVRRSLALVVPVLAGLVIAAGAPAWRLAEAQTATRAAYVAGLEDVPLMAGLVPTRANDVAFDSPLGRIVIVNTEGAVERHSVLEFYAASLDGLGWDRIGDSAFRREGEMLRLEFGQRAQLLTVRFTLSPVR
jgi:hypothetical protein